jgi:hypothetical protein
MGCLKALFVQVGCVVILIAAAIFGWIYRRDLVDAYRRVRGLPTAAALVYAAPQPGDADRARAALERLGRRGGPAYVDLAAGELAALVDAQLGLAPRRVVDSVRVALAADEVLVRASLDMSDVPPRLLGPLAGALDRRESLVVGGGLAADSAGRVYWTITTLRVKDFPFPRSTIPAILRALKVPGLAGVAVPIPALNAVGDVRVSPDHVRLYRSSPR